MIDLFIPIWKPINWSSFDVVKKIRTQIKPAKVGHAGTLDPFAEGVLMLCTGKKTKSINDFMNMEKEYKCEITLGHETDTLDPTGKVVGTADVPGFFQDDINLVLKEFIGKIKQEPPMFSALKVNGQPLYKLAHKGIKIPRKIRTVNIYDLQLINFTSRTITLKVVCGRGTYIRSLAKDIAEKLNTVGHLATLKRTRIGEYNQSSCIVVNDLSKWISART